MRLPGPETPGKEGAGGIRGLGRPAAPGAAGRDRARGMEGTGGRGTSAVHDFKGDVSARAFWGEEGLKKLRSRVPCRSSGGHFSARTRTGPVGQRAKCELTVRCCLGPEVDLVWSGDGAVVMATYGFEFSWGRAWGAQEVEGREECPHSPKAGGESSLPGGCCLHDGAAGKEDMDAPTQC